MFKSLFAFIALASLALAAPAPDKDVYTVTVGVNTLVDHAPYFVTVTEVETFTASPSTTVAHPTGTFVTKLPAHAHA